ncbi:hypothetical protein [Mesorhizobium sp. M1328]
MADQCHPSAGQHGRRPHFPFPGTGTFVKDGNAYGFTPVQI